jgi:hypothetical protein
LALAVAGCGSNGKPDPTPIATTGAGPTVGELADRIAAAWTGVSTFRSVSRDVHAAATPASSPSRPDQVDVTTEVILPDRKRQVSTSNGAAIAELIVIGDDVFVRGSLTQPPAPDGGDWREVDPSALEPGSTDAIQVASLLAPVQPPYAGLSPDERNRIAEPVDTVEVNGQVCQAYEIVDTTQTGERVDVTLAINGDDLPCSIQTKVSGVDYLTTFEFNIPLSISAPVINIRPFQ